MEELKVVVRRLPGTDELPLPAYETPNSAGMDLRAAEDAYLPPGSRTSVGTGICIALPDGYEAQIRPRSGLAFHHGVTLLNTPGTIDPDYRGEIRAVLINLGEVPFTVHRGDRIAQLVVAPVVRVGWVVAEQLPETDRGIGGFGSTGGISAS